MLGDFDDLLNNLAQTCFVKIYILWPEFEDRDISLAQNVDHDNLSP